MQILKKANAVSLGVLGLVFVATCTKLWSDRKVHAADNPKQAEFDSISVHSLKIVDAQGRPRFVIASPLPNPVIAGKETPRSSPVTGIQFLDAQGNEHGGVVTIDSVKGAAICYDYDTAEAMCFTKAFGYKGIEILDPPTKDAKFGELGAERMEFSDNDGHPRIVLMDSKGKDRLVLSIDGKDNPQIQMLDADGKVASSFPPHQEK